MLQETASGRRLEPRSGCRVQAWAGGHCRPRQWRAFGQPREALDRPLWATNLINCHPAESHEGVRQRAAGCFADSDGRHATRTGPTDATRRRASARSDGSHAAGCVQRLQGKPGRRTARAFGALHHQFAIPPSHAWHGTATVGRSATGGTAQMSPQQLADAAGGGVAEAHPDGGDASHGFCGLPPCAS